MARDLSRELRPVGQDLAARGVHVYDPTDYACEPHAHYLRRYATGRGKVLLLGMNPGPWGMGQTGVPFGSVPWARDWLKVKGTIRQPAASHPAHPVLGWACPRVEISGDRLWAMLRDRFGTPAALREHMVVLNYCPLLLLEACGNRCRNLPLAKVSGSRALLGLCDAYLSRAIRLLEPALVIGIGAFAAARLLEVAQGGVAVGKLLHPSPASPLANRGFARQATRQLNEMGVPDLTASRVRTTA